MKLLEIENLFQMDVGAPQPMVVSDDRKLKIFFYSDSFNDAFFENPSPEIQWEIIELKFNRCSFYSMGPPNDEALNGHPYYELGLRSYAFYELLESELIAKLQTYGRFHNYYNPQAYSKKHHYILTFKDGLFECVADSFKVTKHTESAYNDDIPAIERLLTRRILARTLFN